MTERFARKDPSKVLIADPEPFIRDTLKIKLMSKGYDVVSVDSGRDLVRVSGREHPDLILTDIKFKDLDVYRALQILKGKAATKNTPVVILYREEITPEMQFMWSPYVARFVKVPFSPRAVAKTIRDVLAEATQ